jgi:hypothetical protein
MVSNRRRTNKKNKKTTNRKMSIKSKMRNTRKLRYFFGGRECIDHPQVNRLKRRIFRRWRNGRWKLREVNEVSSYFIQRRRPIEHHPVILNLLRSGVESADAFEFYCGGTPFGRPEYEELTFHFRNEIIDDGSQLSEFIKSVPAISARYNRSNILQPQNWHLFLLHFFIEDEKYSKLNRLQDTNEITSLQEKWRFYLKLFTGELIDVFTLGSGHDDDLDARAQIVAERCVRNKRLNRLYTMDGHGRFLCSVIKHIFHRDPLFFERRRDFNIHVVDTDKECNLWHKTTMPLNVSIEGDIFQILNDTIANDDAEKCLFYLNLSGLGGQSDNILTLFTLFNDLTLFDNLIVSFSTVRAGLQPALELIDNLTQMSPLIGGLTNRQDFVTIGTKYGMDYSTRNP